MSTVTLDPVKDVKLDKHRKMYVRCPDCRAQLHLGVWGAAHVGQYELYVDCACGNHIEIGKTTQEYAE